MEYPIKLLPRTNYKSIITGFEEKCLIRHFVADKGQGVLDDLGYLKDYVIASGGERQLPDLSTSLFGIFIESDITYNVINNSLTAYCEPNHNAVLPIFEEDFDIAQNREYWTILVDKIHNQPIVYDGVDFKATCFVVHTPTKSNFWHFSIKWFIDSENKYWDAEDPSISKSIKRKLKKETRDFLKLFAKQEILSTTVISKEHYCNQ